MIYFNRKGLLYSFIQKETRVMNLALFMLTFMLSGLYATESYSCLLYTSDAADE